MKKVALVVSHSQLRQGAGNKTYGLTEYKYNKKFVEELKSKLFITLIDESVEIEIFYRKIGMTTLHRKLNKYKPDIAIEFHCNAFNKWTSGSEILIKNGYSFQYKTPIYDINRQIANALNIPDRGLKFRKKNERGWKFLYNVNAELKFIAEPFFIDNDSDLYKALENQNQLVNIFRDFIKRMVR